MSICVSVTVAHVTTANCGDTFQSQLRDLLAIKQSCDSAGFYDCEQVRSCLQTIVSIICESREGKMYSTVSAWVVGLHQQGVSLLLWSHRV